MIIDVSDSFTLTKPISNPGSNIMLQLATVVDMGLFIHYIDISQTDNVSERAPAIQLVKMSPAATISNAVAFGTNLLRNDQTVNSPDDLPRINTSTSGDTFSSGGSVGHLIWTSNDFDIRLGPMPFLATAIVKPIFIPASTTVALKFATAPAGSHTWRPKISFSMQG